MSENLSFDWFISKIHESFKKLPDHRKHSPNRQYATEDAALGAFSMFFGQSPSFLSFQQEMQQAHGYNNATNLFGIKKIPSDNQIRNILDTIDPTLLYQTFTDTFERLEEKGHLEEYRFFEECLLVLLDGTQYFTSSKIHCSNCTEIKHKNGKTSYSHTVLTPVIAAPGNNKVIALAPEFIMPQDGALKQDCEINAAKRWIKKNAVLAEKKVILLGDDLFSRNPFCRDVLDNKFHFIFTCKRDSHKTLYENIDALEKMGEIQTISKRLWNGRFHEEYVYKFYNSLPINADENALNVNWIQLTIYNTKTQEIIYTNDFITDFHITHDNAGKIVKTGRTRWKVENENNNTLKTKGYHIEHNFGHGNNFLSLTLLTLNLLAFLAHTLLEFVDVIYHAIRLKLARRKRFFDDFISLTTYMLFDNWNHLMTFMANTLRIKLENP